MYPTGMSPPTSSSASTKRVAINITSHIEKKARNAPSSPFYPSSGPSLPVSPPSSSFPSYRASDASYLVHQSRIHQIQRSWRNLMRRLSGSGGGNGPGLVRGGVSENEIYGTFYKPSFENEKGIRKDEPSPAISIILITPTPPLSISLACPFPLPYPLRIPRPMLDSLPSSISIPIPIRPIPRRIPFPSPLIAPSVSFVMPPAVTFVFWRPESWVIVPWSILV